MTDPHADPTAVVLALLGDAGDGYRSGAELAATLGVSRAAVWKRVKSLRAAGYDIEARPRAGYRLVAAPDLLVATRVLPELCTTCVGCELHHYVDVPSTMTVATRLADAGAPEGTVVVAERQTAGRGRLGRTWHSAPGRGIWMTVVLRPALSPAELGPLTLMTAVAVAKGIAAACGVTPGIKWPNDVLLDGQKVCGILTELVAEQDAIRYALVGIGINVHQTRGEFPPDVRRMATSLALATGGPVDRVHVFREVLRALDREYAALREAGYGPVLAEWTARSVTLGSRVSVRTPGRVLRGRATGITPHGGLCVRLDDGREEIIVSGDVTLEK